MGERRRLFLTPYLVTINIELESVNQVGRQKRPKSNSLYTVCKELRGPVQGTLSLQAQSSHLLRVTCKPSDGLQQKKGGSTNLVLWVNVGAELKSLLLSPLIRGFPKLFRHGKGCTEKNSVRHATTPQHSGKTKMGSPRRA